MENKTWQSGKWRRPVRVKPIPEFVEDLEAIRDNLREVKTTEEAMSLVRLLTDAVVQAVIHAEDMQKVLDELKEFAGDGDIADDDEDTLWCRVDDAISEAFQQTQGQLADAKKEDLDLEWVEELMGDEFFEELDEELDGEPPVIGVQLDTEGLDLPSQEGPAPQMMIGEAGVGEGASADEMEIREATESQFDDEVADGLLDEFFGLGGES